MEGIKLIDVTFAYPNGYVAVENINIDIPKGSKIAIVGQNGAGKTTTVKMMNGLLRPKSGKITLEGKDISTMTTATVSRQVGYVFQNPGDQIFNKDVYSEIAYSPRYMKLPEEEIDRLVKDAANLCGIGEFLYVNPYDLPFSLRKFVTIASVVAMGCDYVILDEPTAGQDLAGLQLQNKIIDELINRGKTVITITHDMDFVIENFDKMIVMANKRVVKEASVREIFWDFETLNKAALKQPNICILANKLNIGDNVINIEEFIRETL